MNKKNKMKFWSGEKILSISAMLISIGTFIVFAYQTNLMRRHQYMSVYPHLQFTDYHVHAPNYKYVLTNKGIGPAIITLSEISINGKMIDKDLATYIRESIIRDKDSIICSTSNVHKGLLIGEKETVELVKLLDVNSHKNSVKLFNLIHNDSLNFIIEYKSIYGEKWRLSQKDDLPVKIE